MSDEIAKGDKCRRDCHYQCIETDRQYSFGGSDLPTNYPPKLVITEDTNVISWCCRITGFGTPGKCKTEYDRTRVPYGVGSDCSRAECRRGCDNAYKVADALCDLDKEPITKRICKATAQYLRQICVDTCNAVCTRP